MMTDMNTAARKSACAWAATAAELDRLSSAGDYRGLQKALAAAAPLAATACTTAEIRRLPKADRAAARLFAEAFADALRMLPERQMAAIAARIRDAVGETALMLSGGGKLGNYHIGVIRVLHEGGLLPRIISGSSAGSIMAAMIGSRTDADLRDMLKDDARNLLANAATGEMDYDVTTLDQARVKTLIARIVPDMTFAEARAISGRDICISVARARAGHGGMVLNAGNAGDVLLRDAVLASCAVPYVYAPVVLHRRDAKGAIRPFAKGVRWIDGSVHADMPAAFLRAQFGVTRTIASVVNPFELPLLTDPDLHGPWIHGWASMMTGMTRSLASAWMAALLPAMRRVPVAGRVLALTRDVVDQRIDADVIIAPGSRFFDPMTLLQQASAAQMADFIAEGETATMARLDLIEPALRIEAALRAAPAVNRATAAA